ncbi:hypothetical protein A6R68_21675 [Neotoma lepida]|uniref:Uncharacterized protein n=1 Tax=Neotoma lepida TaxID=56216 RepID=A0A1A6HPF0_NEOLE|nr:hypothetical protein A6R68_21675 [Neotoma lepida]
MHRGIHSIPELRSPAGWSSFTGAQHPKHIIPLSAPYSGGHHLHELRPRQPFPAGPAQARQLSAPPAEEHRQPGGEREAAGGFRGPPAPGLRLQVHRRSPAGAPSRSPAAPLPARPFFSIHADAQGCRRRRQRGRRRRPSGLAGGRGAGTFPRPAARAAHRRRCRRGPGTRPGQSGRAGRRLAGAGLLPWSRGPASAPAPPRLPRPPSGPGKGRSVGKGWLSFNRRLSVSGISVRALPAAER